MTTHNTPDKQGEAPVVAGANGHVHKFGIVNVPPELGHSYRRCTDCLLSVHLEGHDPIHCELCNRSRPIATPEPPMCAVHAALDGKDKLVLEVGNGCVACSLHERTALLNLLEPFAADDASQDSLTVLRNLITSRASVGDDEPDNLRLAPLGHALSGITSPMAQTPEVVAVWNEFWKLNSQLNKRDAAASSSAATEPPPHDRDSYKAGWDAAVAAIKTFGMDEIDAIENATSTPAEPLQPTTDPPRCPKCGYVMCQQFDSRPVNAVADIVTPNGKYICYHCTPLQPEGEQSLITENPFEQIVERALLRAGVSYVTDHGGGNPARLDFYLPRFDVHIEVKTMHSERVAEQMSRAANVVVAQGRAAIEWLAAQINPATPPPTPSDAAMRAAEEIAESEAHYHHENCWDKDEGRIAAIITRHFPTTVSQLHPYERALTVDWDTHNARRHDLITKKRSATLSDDEANEFHELQWLAGVKREILSGPPPLTLSTIAAALRTQENQ